MTSAQIKSARAANQAAKEKLIANFKLPLGAKPLPLHKTPPPGGAPVRHSFSDGGSSVEPQLLTLTPAQLATQAAKNSPQWLAAFMAKSSALPSGDRAIDCSTLTDINRTYPPACCGGASPRAA